MIVHDPVVTAEYEAIAAALRPHAVDGLLGELTFPQVVGIAAAAVAPIVDGLRAGRDEARAHALRMESEAADVFDSVTRSARGLVEATTDALASKIAELEGRADWWRLESERNARRLAALEALRVQAEARWGHEGGPSLLRETLDAAREA